MPPALNAHRRALLAHWRRAVARWDALAPRVADETGLLVWNPGRYGLPVYARYAAHYTPSKPGAIAAFGLNPGKYGMAQTGLPFTDAWTARHTLTKLAFAMDAPALAPPDLLPFLKPTRRERSCRSVYGFLERAYGSAEAGLSDVWFPVPCPLLFLKPDGANVTPADAALRRVREVDALRLATIEDALRAGKPRAVVFLGQDVAKVGREAAEAAVGAENVMVMDHPVARGPGRHGPAWWAETFEARLRERAFLSARRARARGGRAGPAP